MPFLEILICSTYKFPCLLYKCQLCDELLNHQINHPMILLVNTFYDSHHDERKPPWVQPFQPWICRSAKLWKKINLSFSSLDVDAALRSITGALVRRGRTNQVLWKWEQTKKKVSAGRCLEFFFVNFEGFKYIFWIFGLGGIWGTLKTSDI